MRLALVAVLEPKEPALSPAPRHRAPETGGRGGLFARIRAALATSAHPRLFLPTALACAGLLIAAPLAILFSGGLPGGGGSGGSGGGNGNGNSGSGGPGSAYQPGAPQLTTAARRTDARGGPVPAAERRSIGAGATLTGQAPGGAAANGGSGAGGAGGGGGAGVAGGQPVGGGGSGRGAGGGGSSGGGGTGGGGTGGGGSSGGGGTGGGGSSGGGGTGGGGGGGGCICTTVASLTSAAPVPTLPKITTPTLPKLTTPSLPKLTTPSLPLAPVVTSSPVGGLLG